MVLAALAVLTGCSLGCRKASPSPPLASSPAAPSRALPAAPASSVALPAASSAASSAPPATSSASEPAWIASAELREVTWSWDDTPLGPMRVVVEIPANADEHHRLPVLVTMHGKGEAQKGPDRGARGWIDDYWLPKAVHRLADPPLTRGDLLGFADGKRLALINRSLAERPYQGLIVACPYTPETLHDDELWERGGQLAAFLVDQVLPKLRKETPSLDAVGLDGVSLGGRAALVVGLTRPEAFQVVASMQAAFDTKDAPELARRAAEAVKKNPSLQLRLLTSDHDYYLQANKAISRAMTKAGVKNELVVVPGPHAYEFNRGPAVYEMLLLHDRALRGQRFP